MSCTVQCSNHNTNDLCVFVWDMNILRLDETIRLIKKKNDSNLSKLTIKMLIYLYNHEKFEFVRMFPRYFLIAWKKKTQQRGLHKIMIDFPIFRVFEQEG